jgi:hypothetical protein
MSTRGWVVNMAAAQSHLARARRILDQHGIRARQSRARRAEGMLRVEALVAERARALLRSRVDPATLLEAAEAAWLSCHRCGAALALGAPRCPACGADVSDPSGG